MSKTHYTKNGNANERKKPSYSKEEEDLEKSDDSDKQILVVNRMIKSKIFLDSSQSSKNNVNNRIIKRKNTNISHNAAEKIIQNRKTQTGILMKSTLTSSQIKNAEKEMQRSHTSLTTKNNKIMNKSEKKDNIKMVQNVRKKNNSENKAEMDRNSETNILRSEKHHNSIGMESNFFAEIINSICVDSSSNTDACVPKYAITTEWDNAPTGAMGSKIINQRGSGSYKKVMNKIQHLSKINQNYGPTYPYSHDTGNQMIAMKYGNSCEETYTENYSCENVIKQSNHLGNTVDEQMDGRISHLDNDYIYEFNQNNHSYDKKEDTYVREPNEDTTSVIKYGEFELYEINEELEKIIEEENSIQEQLIYLTNKELDIDLKIKQKKHRKIVAEKDGQKTKGDDEDVQ
ncbi:conserved Plasmodium protein, unknown function [Plasmodium ovale]|uniref:Uncharacterized protein n=2 Tax=Plasmodium ovale TaxID=36330 RepID=A0A1A8WCX6_PLAOA|nr:conserved Plasmodium protein, unknown function [Plasmodium ovale curtisi]SBS90717.1 conserved Plasmodium protein, unknown function [Plasmodium ovale curtisi]SCP04473.1 conserved Plasmodium protein, unknown function [Plasmodium ovale]